MSSFTIGSKLNINKENNDNKDSFTEGIPDIDSNSIERIKDNSKRDFFCAILEKSSVPALSQLGQAQSGKCRLFWTVVLLMSVIGCIYEINIFLATFLQFPVLIDVQAQNRIPQEFPAVTVCNLNRIRSEHFPCVEKGFSWLECQDDASSLHFAEESNETSELEKSYKNRSDEILSAYSMLSVLSRKCYGHRLPTLVKRCSFDSVHCNSTDFSYFYDTHYGNCYTFNKPTKEDKASRSVKKAGPGSGLELVLDIELHTYTEISPSAGARVIIHNPQEDPNPLEGINILPGFESHVSVVKTSHHRLPAPYRDSCENYDGNSQRSLLACSNECAQSTSMLKCGCIDPFLPNYKNWPDCSLENTTQMSCLVRVVEDMSTDNVSCPCPLSCTRTIYDLQISSTKWRRGDQPNNMYFGATNDPCFCTTLFGSTEESLTRLKVFFRSLDNKIYAQKPMYSDSELYSHLGGNLTLWLGLSLVAVYEFSENIFFFLKRFLSARL